MPSGEQVFVLPWGLNDGVPSTPAVRAAEVDSETWRSLDWLVRTALPAWLDAARCPAAAVGPRSADKLDSDHAAVNAIGTLAVILLASWERCSGSEPAALEAEAMTSVIMFDCGVWQASQRAGRLVVKDGEFELAAPVAEVCRQAILSLVADAADAVAIREVWPRLRAVMEGLRETAPEPVPDAPVLSCDDAAAMLASRVGAGT